MYRFVLPVLHVFTAVIIINCVFTYSLLAAPITDSQDRLDLNWGTMKMNFYGVSTAAKGEDSEALKTAEKEAWGDGLQYIHNSVRKISADYYKTMDNGEEESKEAAKRISTSTYSTNTTYYADGKVKVELENSIPKMFKISSLKFKQKETPDISSSANSGIRFKLSNKVTPKAHYIINDESGKIIFDTSFVSEDAYDEHGMGKWFNKPTKDEIKRAIGDNPVEIEVSVANGNMLVVNSKQWAELLKKNEALLTASKIVLVNP